MPLTKTHYERLASQVDRTRLSQQLAAMVRISSVNPFGEEAIEGKRELELATYLLNAFETLGLETGSAEVAPGRPNVWGTLKGEGTGPSLGASCHKKSTGSS